MIAAQKITLLSNFKENSTLEGKQKVTNMCRNGLHDLSLDNAKKPDGRCRMCQRATDVRYRRSDKGQQARQRYNRSTGFYYEVKGKLHQRILRKFVQISRLEGLLR